MTLKEILQGTAFALGGYRWWAAAIQAQMGRPLSGDRFDCRPCNLDKIAADFQALGRKL